MENQIDTTYYFQPENRDELLNIFKGSVIEFNRFIAWLRSRNYQFESFDANAKRNIVAQYLDEGDGNTPFRVGRDG